MNRLYLTMSVSLTSAALAATPTYSVVAGNQVAPEPAIVVQGVTYVPLSALKLLGIQTSLRGNTLTLAAPGALPAAGTSPGGADQRASLEGCLGAPLFNGVWRLTVNTSRPITRYNGQQKGYSLNLSWKNGTVKTIDALNTGVRAITLVLQDGATLTSEDEQKLTYKKLPQGAGTTVDLNFWAETAQSAAGLATPSKLLFEIGASGAVAAGVAYTTPTPSFRVRLDCQR